MLHLGCGEGGHHICLAIIMCSRLGSLLVLVLIHFTSKGVGVSYWRELAYRHLATDSPHNMTFILSGESPPLRAAPPWIVVLLGEGMATVACYYLGNADPMGQVFRFFGCSFSYHSSVVLDLPFDINKKISADCVDVGRQNH
jgi:hypothetical protein